MCLIVIEIVIEEEKLIIRFISYLNTYSDNCCVSLPAFAVKTDRNLLFVATYSTIDEFDQQAQIDQNYFAVMYAARMESNKIC